MLKLCANLTANSEANQPTPENTRSRDSLNVGISPQDSDENCDSDSLDSGESRKRRKLSPTVNTSQFFKSSAPSRITKKLHQNTEPNLRPTEANLTPSGQTVSFASLGVKPWLVRSLGSMSIKKPTSIQKECIPEILKGRDCIGGSRTGSGKTVAFAVPILQRWAEDLSGIFALVLTPTRYSS